MFRRLLSSSPQSALPERHSARRDIRAGAARTSSEECAAARVRCERIPQVCVRAARDDGTPARWQMSSKALRKTQMPPRWYAAFAARADDPCRYDSKRSKKIVLMTLTAPIAPLCASRQAVPSEVMRAAVAAGTVRREEARQRAQKRRWRA